MQTAQTMETLTPAKAKEWRDWGKDAYKSTSSMMRGNSHHKDYDTAEKREAIHDANEAGTGQSAYNWTEAGREKLRSRFGYSDEAIEEARKAWIDGYSASRKWYTREDAKQRAVLDSYATVFKEAEELAKSVDVSDIVDGFPCGSAHLYLDYACRETPLGKALAHFNGGSTMQYRYRLPVKMPTYGQCVAFDERICNKVQTFLRARGILANTYSWID